MLNSYDKGSDAQSRDILSRPADLAPSIDDEAGTLTVRRPLARLIEQRWLVLLFAVILFSLVIVYRLPWEAQAAALFVAAAGAAVMPRPAMKQGTPEVIAAPLPQVDPLHIAASVIDALPEPAILLSRREHPSIEREGARPFRQLEARISYFKRHPQPSSP